MLTSWGMGPFSALPMIRTQLAAPPRPQAWDEPCRGGPALPAFPYFSETGSQRHYAVTKSDGNLPLQKIQLPGEGAVGTSCEWDMGAGMCGPAVGTQPAGFRCRDLGWGLRRWGGEEPCNCDSGALVKNAVSWRAGTGTCLPTSSSRAS